MSWLTETAATEDQARCAIGSQGDSRGLVGQVSGLRGGVVSARTWKAIRTCVPSAGITCASALVSVSTYLLDPEGRFEIGSEVVPIDPLKFKDSASVIRSPRGRQRDSERDRCDGCRCRARSRPCLWWLHVLNSSSSAVRWGRWSGSDSCAVSRRRSKAQTAVYLHYRFGRGADAGGLVLADADGQDHGGGYPTGAPPSFLSSRC
jgi:hypothetical protein